MKLKLFCRSGPCCSEDGESSEHVEQGAIKEVEFSRTLCVAGNPIDPWRIVIDLEVEH